MIAQELLDALNKAQNETNLDQIAVWALSKYMQGVWKDGLGKNIRPFDLGKIMSNFFVDLSQHRLPEKITKQTPETEPMLMKFFGADEGSLSRFWTQCIEIWNVTLEAYPAYAKEVKKYFDMLLQSSLQERHPDSPAVSIEASSKPSVEAPSVPIKSHEKTAKADDSVFTEEIVPETPAMSSVTEDVPEPMVFPKSAYLILQGTRVIPLNQPLITIGRQLNNHIILEDPRVSRSHAQIKLINDHFVIFDMKSTGGTYVNGRRTGQSVLYPGDVISLAGVKFIYSQEMPAKPGELKIIELGSPFAADRPTAVMHKEAVKPIEKADVKELPDLPKTGPLK